MAMNAISTTARDAMCNALVDLIDSGAGANGTLEIGTTSFASTLAILDFTAKATGAFDASGSAGGNADGVATANAISDETSCPATGTATECRVKDCDGNVLFEGSAGISSTDLILNTASITIGDTVSISAATVTMPAA